MKIVTIMTRKRLLRKFWVKKKIPKKKEAQGVEVPVDKNAIVEEKGGEFAVTKRGLVLPVGKSTLVTPRHIIKDTIKVDDLTFLHCEDNFFYCWFPEGLRLKIDRIGLFPNSGNLEVIQWAVQGGGNIAIVRSIGEKYMEDVLEEARKSGKDIKIIHPKGDVVSFDLEYKDGSPAGPLILDSGKNKKIEKEVHNLFCKMLEAGAESLTPGARQAIKDWVKRKE